MSGAPRDLTMPELVEAHARALAGVGADAVPIKRAAHLDGVDALILPGGESTTIAKGLERLDLYEPLEAFGRSGKPVLGTCAGAILLAREVANHPVRSLGLIDVVAARNAYGTQVDSFAGPVEEGIWQGMPCVFIRAPRLEKVGDGVEVLAWLGGAPVAVRQDNVWATTFHPELTDDPRVHRALVDAAALC